MKNILFLGISEKNICINEFEDVIQKINVDNCFFILNERKDVKCFEKNGKCFLREKVAKGEYSINDVKMDCCVPLDDIVFNYMAPHTIEIMTQQRRFEEYHAFQISKSYESHYMIYMHNLFFWNNFLETEKITHVFFSCLPHEGYDSIIYHLSKMKNIHVRMLYNSTLPRRYYVLSDFMNLDESLGDAYQELCKKYQNTEEIPLDEQAEGLYKKWTSLEPAKMKPWYMEGDPLKRRFGIRFGTTNMWVAWYHLIGSIYAKYDYKMCIQFVFECIENIPEFVRVGIKTFKNWRYSRPAWKRTLELNQYYEEIAQIPVEGERYIYFAMHYQPEASSNPLGGREYADQMFAIHLLARSVPEDIKIYVKVHPEQLAPLRSKEYYADINRIPNVRLIKSKCSTYDLIQKSFAVSSLTGTVCWEAQFFGIPAILFGYSHKNLAPLTYHVRTHEECIEAVKGIEENKKTTTMRELRILLKAMYEESFDEKEMKERLPEILIDFLTK